MTDIGKIIHSLDQRLKAVERSSRLSSASIDNTALEVRDDSGSLRGLVGQQGDGTTAINIVNGPTPPAPTNPTVEPALAALTVTWDGAFADAVAAPLDWMRCEVHIGPTDDFIPSQGTLRDTIETPQGGMVTIPLPYTEWHVKLRSRTSSGAVSTPTSAVAGTPRKAETADLTAGIITADLIAVDALTGKTITGGTVTGATVRTAATGARVVLDTAMRLYNPAGEPLAEAVPDATALGYPNDAGYIVYNTVGIGRYWAMLSRGFIRFGKDGEDYRWGPLIDHYLSGGSTSVMKLGSGAIESGGEEENEATISLVGTNAATPGDHPHVDIGGSGIRDSGRADLNVSGNITTPAVLTAGNIRAGRVSITPSAANTPTSATVTGLGIPAAVTPRATATASTAVPGTQVTGVGISALTNTSMTIWLTRTNTTTTNIDWIAIGA